MKIMDNRDKQFREDTKRFRNITDLTIKCKCGHSVVIGTFGRKICTHCGRWVFKTPKDEFDFRMKELL